MPTKRNHKGKVVSPYPDARPKPFTWKTRQQAVDKICVYLRTGRYTLNMIRDQAVPRIGKSTLNDWRVEDAKIAEQIDDAFETGTDNMFAEIGTIADSVSTRSANHIPKAKLQMYAREKLAQRWNARYRDRVVHTNDPDNPVPPQFIVQPTAPRDRDDPSSED